MTQTRRLIEESIPLHAISEQSAREKSIRHGHISTLHIWWARRPLAACRAAVFAALVDAPEGDEQRENLEDLITDIVDWDHVKDGNSAKIEEARHIIAQQWGEETPRVLDPFAGGGAIPLEALRLGCETHALELNPVAHLIELCTLVYPQKYGQPDSREVPAYIRAKDTEEGGQKDVAGDGPWAQSYRRNPLAIDVRYWGEWVLQQAEQKIGQYYSRDLSTHSSKSYVERSRDTDPEAGTVVAYLWARTARCPNPACGAEMPLVRQGWLARRGQRKRVALKPVVDRERNEVTFQVVRGEEIDFNPKEGTMRRGNVRCLFCNQTADADYLRAEGEAGRLSQMPLAVALTKPGELGKAYRPTTEVDRRNYAEAKAALEQIQAEATDGFSLVPDEPIPTTELRRLSVPLYGMDTWGKLFNGRQALALVTFSYQVQAVYSQLVAATDDAGYARGVVTCLAMIFDRLANQNTTLCRIDNSREIIAGTYARQALGMVWDYGEVNPFSGSTGDWTGVQDWVVRVIEHCWLKRTIGDLYLDTFRTPLTLKGPEIVQDRPHSRSTSVKDAAFYEREMTRAFQEVARVLRDDGIFTVVFAHTSTAAWETLISGLLNAGLVVTASWPLHTEMATRVRAMDTASLASSIFMVCKKRPAGAPEGYFDVVSEELHARIRERLDFFWEQGIRGADFLISAIGPAVEVFGRYQAVRRLSGEEITVGELLDLVNEIVTDYALHRILSTSSRQRLRNGHVGEVDEPSRFYVLWRWSYGDNKVPFDDARMMAQAQGVEVSRLMNKLNLLKQRGENVEILGPRRRLKSDPDLGLPDDDGRMAPRIDALHRAILLWEKGDREALAEFLGRSGYAGDEHLWTLAQSLSQILPDGDKEKQLLQGLLGQRDRVQLDVSDRQGPEQGRLL